MPNSLSGDDDDAARSKYAGRWVQAREAPADQPPAETAFEKQIRRDADICEARRAEIREAVETLRQQEIEKTLGDVTDPEMQDLCRVETDRIDAKYARMLNQRLDVVDHDQNVALFRAMREHDRYDHLQPATKDAVVAAEKVRTDRELQHERAKTDEKMAAAEKGAKREFGDDPAHRAEKEAHLDAVQLALEEKLELRQRQIEREARERLERMLESYGPDL